MKNNNIKNDSVELLQLVSFIIENEKFAVDIHKVQEINRVSAITSVPNAPYFIDGVINLRGIVIPVIDLRARLGMARKDHNNNTRIIVVEIQDKTVGFIVDSVNEVLRIPTDITEPPPKLVEGKKSKYITAVAKLDDRLIILLDLELILSEEEFSELDSAAA